MLFLLCASWGSSLAAHGVLRMEWIKKVLGVTTLAPLYKAVKHPSLRLSHCAMGLNSYLEMLILLYVYSDAWEKSIGMCWKEDLCHKTRSRAIFFEGYGGENCSLLLGLLWGLKNCSYLLGSHVCILMCMCYVGTVSTHVMVRTEVRKLVLSYYVALRDCQVIRLGGKHLSPLYHLIGPERRSWGTLDFRKEP